MTSSMQTDFSNSFMELLDEEAFPMITVGVTYLSVFARYVVRIYCFSNVLLHFQDS